MKRGLLNEDRWRISPPGANVETCDPEDLVFDTDHYAMGLFAKGNVTFGAGDIITERVNPISTQRTYRRIISFGQTFDAPPLALIAVKDNNLPHGADYGAAGSAWYSSAYSHLISPAAGNIYYGYTMRAYARVRRDQIELYADYTIQKDAGYIALGSFAFAYAVFYTPV